MPSSSSNTTQNNNSRSGVPSNTKGQGRVQVRSQAQGQVQNASKKNSVASHRPPLTPEQENIKACKTEVWKSVMDDCKKKGQECVIVKGCAENGFVLPGTNEPLIGSELWPLGDPPRQNEDKIAEMYGDDKMFRKAMKCVGRKVNEEYGTQFQKCYPEEGTSRAANNANNNNNNPQVHGRVQQAEVANTTSVKQRRASTKKAQTSVSRSQANGQSRVAANQSQQ